MATPAAQYFRAFQVNNTATSFSATVATATEPANDGVIVVPNGATTMDLLFFGAGADNTTFDARIIGWRSTGAGRPLWIPSIIVEVSTILCAAVGVAGYSMINTDRFADTITKNFGLCAIVPVLADSSGSLVTIDVSGMAKVEMTVDLTGATNANALYALFD